jgi:hypothetical protein
MQSVKLLLLVLLTFTLLSCETTKPATPVIGAAKTSQCGELPAGVTIDKREFRLAGAKLGEFSLGEVGINSTPEFTQILSEASKNKVVQSVLTCNAIELAGVSHDAEMVAYFIEMQDFLSSNPSLDDRIKWKKAFPFPKAARQEQSTPQESLSDRLVRTCKQPLDGLNRQPQEFVPIWLGPLRQLHHEKFPAQRDLQSLYNIKGHLRDYYNTPEDFFRESLYTLKCLMDAGEIIRLENTGTTGKVGDKVFENQRIVFP